MSFKGIPGFGPGGTMGCLMTYFFAPSQPQIDEDAQAFLDAASITDETITSAIDDLVVSLKAESLWGKMSAIYPLVGGTSASCKFNLKNPADTDGAYRLTFTGSNSFSSDGVTFPASGANYANTHFDQANFNTTDCSISVFAKQFNGDGYSQFRANNAIGDLPGNILIWVRPSYAPYYSAFGADWGYDAFSGPSDTGFYISSRISGTQKLYLNGTALLSHTNTGSTASSADMALGGDPFYGIGSDSLINFASIGEGLSDSEAAELNTIVQAFQTALGR